MATKVLIPLYEGSWALMLDELAIRAHEKYGIIAGLDINYYLSIGSKRYYKAYLDEQNVFENQNRLIDFLLDSNSVRDCIEKIHSILNKLNDAENQYSNFNVFEKFNTYCDYCCEYLGYYNSVASDIYCQKVFDMVNEAIPVGLQFASRLIKESLFATDNSDLLTYRKSVDWISLVEMSKKGVLKSSDVSTYASRYKSITTSSGNPQGLTEKEIESRLSQINDFEDQFEKAFVKNLNIRYTKSEIWSKCTAESLFFDEKLITLIKNTNQLSHLRMLMREAFQQFKEISKKNFLTELISEIGKERFDYMKIDEICDYLSCNKMVSDDVLSSRKISNILEMRDNKVRERCSAPTDVTFSDYEKRETLIGETVLGSGINRYVVRRVEQDERGLVDFDEFIENTSEKNDIAIVTDTLKPFLIPKVKSFGAIITQHGGFTSHAAVLCHELGIKSVIGVQGVMNSLNTGDYIEINFTSGAIKKTDNLQNKVRNDKNMIIEINSDAIYSNHEVGNKAANLINISKIVRVPRGFVLTQYALNNLNDNSIRESIFNSIKSMSCKQIAIRSSHESEDAKNRSYAGMFKSYTNVNVDDENLIFEYINSVFNSGTADTVNPYSDNLIGNMFVIIQEMIDADVSGVVLSSKPNNGFDYILVDYFFGNLCYVMEGTVTPFSSYIKKIDVINGRVTSDTFIPSIIDSKLIEKFVALAQTGIKLEKEFLNSVEIEWGIKDGNIYIFQARPY